MELVALPAFTDNYIWMMHDGREALVVDPGDAAPVLDALSRLQLSLTAILVTHHHADHIGGLSGLLPVLSGPLYGPSHKALPSRVQTVTDQQTLSWCDQSIQVLAVPGHTLSHVAYLLPANGARPPRLFCGDTLFSAGCGRLFEGSPVQMLQSLDRLAALPGDTEVCCAHEYTQSNLRFALAADPDNSELKSYAAQCTRWREQGQPTLPSTLALETRINPFLRCREPALQATAQAHGAVTTDPLQVFTALREWKNHYQ